MKRIGVIPLHIETAELARAFRSEGDNDDVATRLDRGNNLTNVLLRVRQASYKRGRPRQRVGYMKSPKNDLLILEEQEYDTVR